MSCSNSANTASIPAKARLCAAGFRLERAGEILVASDDSSGKALTVFPQLLGRTLLRVEASPTAREAVFCFDEDLALRCFPLTPKAVQVGACIRRTRIQPIHVEINIPDEISRFFGTMKPILSV
jgi:hypothetical protein